MAKVYVVKKEMNSRDTCDTNTKVDLFSSKKKAIAFIEEQKKDIPVYLIDEYENGFMCDKFDIHFELKTVG